MSARRLLDAGSGAGLPGVVIVIMEADLAVVCADAVGKKAAFVRQVAGELAIDNLAARHSRVEALDECFDIVASRALSSLAQLVHLSRKALGPEGVWMAMKGHFPAAEIAELPASVEMFHVEQLAVPAVPDDRWLVWLRPLLQCDA